MKAVSLLTLSLALLCAGSVFSATNVKVKTPLGTVVGVQQGDVDVFKGLPYAEPPVGELRWRETVPVKSWESGEARSADAFSDICPQVRFGDPESWKEGMSEDCLYLNIWRPHEAETKAKLPVMVWIHGGAFVFGSGSVDESIGNSFAESGVILVTINYRLGRLGHFAFPALTKMHGNESKGSYAYMDQVEALRWLKANIEAFNGDHNNVTIFGESAGGVSVHSLLSIADAEGLFHKAIVQSGGGRDGVLTARPLSENNADPHYPESAEQIGINFAEFAGIKGTDEKALAQLMALPFEAIVAGGAEKDPDTGKPIYSGPIKDGKLVQRTAETAYKQNMFNKVPLIIGSNTAEVPAGFVNAPSKDALWSAFGEFASNAANAYDPQGNRELDEVLTYVNTDKVWAEPARFTARIFAEHDLPVYVYRFGYVPEALRGSLRYGAPHASEIPYVFNNPDARRGNLPITVADKKVSGTLNAYWVNFAKTGNPNGEALPEWPRFSGKSSILLKVNKDGNTSSLPDPTTERLDLIEKTVESNQF